MNKRDFLVQGGALVSAVASGASWAAQPAAGHTGAQPLSQQARWQALLGERFSGATTLGRPIELRLSQVSAHPLATATQATQGTPAEQFTVSFEGPRAMPLQAGLYPLQHPTAGTVQLYLEPVSHGERIVYDAHFSLLGPRIL